MQALECYKLALNKEPSNAYAANGIGVVLAEEGSMATAKAIFTKVLSDPLESSFCTFHGGRICAGRTGGAAEGQRTGQITITGQGGEAAGKGKQPCLQESGGWFDGGGGFVRHGQFRVAQVDGTPPPPLFPQVEEAVAANPSWQIVLPDAHLNLANVHLACQVRSRYLLPLWALPLRRRQTRLPIPGLRECHQDVPECLEPPLPQQGLSCASLPGACLLRQRKSR